MTPKLTPAQIKRRAAYARLVASLPVRQHTSINTEAATVKQKPASGVFASA